MSNEKENEMINRSSSSDIDEFYEDPDNDIEEPVDVRQYVINLGQAGIHGPETIRSALINSDGWRTKRCVNLRV